MTTPADGLAPTRRTTEGLYRCACGAVVAKDRQGRRITPVLGHRHICEPRKEDQTKGEATEEVARAGETPAAPGTEQP